jgi:hypothetical protein
MSGRPKPGRGDEAEQLRQLTREAHEAAQAIHAAIREYQEVIKVTHDELLERLEANLRREVDAGMAALNKHMKDQDTALQGRLLSAFAAFGAAEEAVRDRMRKLHLILDAGRAAAESLVAREQQSRPRKLSS